MDMLTAPLETRRDNSLRKKDGGCPNGRNNRGALDMPEILYYFFRFTMTVSVLNIASEAEALNFSVKETVGSSSLKERND